MDGVAFELSVDNESYEFYPNVIIVTITEELLDIGTDIRVSLLPSFNSVTQDYTFQINTPGVLFWALAHLAGPKRSLNYT